MAPVGGVDYPRSYAELRSWFAEDAACLDYLDWLRWPRDWSYPVCEGGVGWRLSNGRRECAACGRQTSATAGTIFHRTRTPLTVWFAAAWQMTSQKHGISALGLKRVLGLGSYQTAWALLHRFRVAMVRPGRERLAGAVEVDESYVGGNEAGATGRQTDTKARVAIAVESLAPKGIGRIRLGHVLDVSAASLIPFVQASVEPGATVRTDGWQAYWTLPDHGYTHDRVVMRRGGDPAHVAMPNVHLVASLLKRWLLGTHQGACTRPTCSPTSTSSPSGLTGGDRERAGCSSTDSSSRPPPRSQSPTGSCWSPRAQSPVGTPPHPALGATPHPSPYRRPSDPGAKP